MSPLVADNCRNQGNESWPQKLLMHNEQVKTKLALYYKAIFGIRCDQLVEIKIAAELRLKGCWFKTYLCRDRIGQRFEP